MKTIGVCPERFHIRYVVLCLYGPIGFGLSLHSPISGPGLTAVVTDAINISGAHGLTCSPKPKTERCYLRRRVEDSGRRAGAPLDKLKNVCRRDYFQSLLGVLREALAPYTYAGAPPPAYQRRRTAVAALAIPEIGFASHPVHNAVPYLVVQNYEKGIHIVSIITIEISRRAPLERRRPKFRKPGTAARAGATMEARASGSARIKGAPLRNILVETVSRPTVVTSVCGGRRKRDPSIRQTVSGRRRRIQRVAVALHTMIKPTICATSAHPLVAHGG
ncbi:hypothetical protein EVAR_61469_1 [Eumeta japonica]|uniref:Uncharacterized protein n=1 Tax=Eumeta variegata TaxID=151549 RepID=A0A4C1Z2P4_EUMVA|nr:hypothetical protein EVAR_61469_1 [Eumeta japonica]